MRVRRQLETHLDERFTLSDAARIAGLHPHYFSTFFHTRTGMRFVEWVHSVRIGYARALLAGTDAPIAEVARRVGYRDLRTFERAFRRCAFTTPGEYRKGARRP